jgi:hypothetical protein
MPATVNACSPRVKVLRNLRHAVLFSSYPPHALWLPLFVHAFCSGASLAQCLHLSLRHYLLQVLSTDTHKCACLLLYVLHCTACQPPTAVRSLLQTRRTASSLGGTLYWVYLHLQLTQPPGAASLACPPPYV